MPSSGESAGIPSDGAAMWIGDQNVFWSVGQSPKTTDSWGQVALQRGVHPVTISYFQAYGPMAMALYVEGPGMKKQRVPASMFFRPAVLAHPHDRAMRRRDP